MKIVCISDTHGLHKGLELPPGDMVIHAGDVSGRGEKHEIVDFLNWFSTLDYKYKIFIAGNHDFFFEKASQEEIEKLIPSGVNYLNDSEIVVEGLKIWGSPIQPWFNDWAFNRERGEKIRTHWEKIPSDTDILITHGPAFGILDKTTSNEQVGCFDLLNKVKEVKPQVHISGHIHEAYGRLKMFETEFINASLLNVYYRRVHAPVILDI